MRKQGEIRSSEWEILAVTIKAWESSGPFGGFVSLVEGDNWRIEHFGDGDGGMGWVCAVYRLGVLSKSWQPRSP